MISCPLHVFQEVCVRACVRSACTRERLRLTHVTSRTPCTCFRYSFEGVLQAIYGFEREPLECEEEGSSEPQHQRQGCLFSDGESVLKVRGTSGSCWERCGDVGRASRCGARDPGSIPSESVF